MSLGLPLARLDGAAKVTGAARFTADHYLPDQLHAVLVSAPIPAGRLLSVDALAALAQDGVVRVLTSADLPRLGPAPSPPLASTFMPLQGDEIRHEGQPVAIVLAETLEQAEDGARRVVLTCERRAFSVPDGLGWDARAVLPDRSPGYLLDEVEFSNGNADAALAAAPVRHVAVYGQPSRHANPIEPSATLAVWDGDRLTCYDAVQHGGSAQIVLACAFGLQPEQVRVICERTGGGFGSKGYIWPHQVLAAAAARVCGRPVKLVLSRAAMYSTVGYQPLMRQRVALGSDADGQLAAVRHDVLNVTSASDDYVECATMTTKGLYASPVLACTYAVQRHDVNMPGSIRTPFEGPGSFALECAMDELAHAVQIDPLDLRLRNHADVHPVSGRPWSSKKLREAYEEGATLFAWRDRAPGWDGPWRVGHGMATCSMGTFRFPSKARLTLSVDGAVTLESSFHDIGTGTSTIFAQVAAEVLGIEPARIILRTGDTTLPPAAPTYASTSTISVGTAVRLAAEDLRRRIARLANLPPTEVVMRDGQIGRMGSVSAIPVAAILEAVGLTEVTGEGDFALPGGAPFEVHGGLTPFAMRSFGAIFVEVGVDPVLGTVRLRRAVGSYSAGRILNPRTARAQMIGGIVWEWGKAVMEESRHDPDLGRWLSKDLSGVSLPVNADVPGNIVVHFVDEFDPVAGPLGAKGVGELAATGVAAAVANAVFDATGRRLRELPITPSALLAPTARA